MYSNIKLLSHAKLCVENLERKILGNAIYGTYISRNAKFFTFSMSYIYFDFMFKNAICRLQYKSKVCIACVLFWQTKRNFFGYFTTLEICIHTASRKNSINTTRTHLSKGKFICITKLQLSRLKVYILSHSHNQLKFVYHFSITCLYKMHKISFMKILYRRKKVHISMVSFLGILCLIRIGKKIQFFIETMNFYSLQKNGEKGIHWNSHVKIFVYKVFICEKYLFKNHTGTPTSI